MNLDNNPIILNPAKLTKEKMRIHAVEIYNFRSFEALGLINLKALNVIVGKNNSGKSSIIKAIHLIQQGSGNPYPDVRAGSFQARIFVVLDTAESSLPWIHDGQAVVAIKTTINSTERTSGTVSVTLEKIKGGSVGFNGPQIPNRKPSHSIIPFLSKRKTSGYNEDVRLESTENILDNFSNLPAKLAKISNPSYPGFAQYEQTCKKMLGFMVSAIPSANGQRAGIYLPNKEALYIDQMGEGISHIVAMLAELADAEGKIFLIEEPENDMHPAALKALLDYIVDRSKTNQFIISTHSNIVLRRLGSMKDCNIIKVEAEDDTLPTKAIASIVEREPGARLEILRSLGYEFSDLELRDGWLILEESSAEFFINKYLIPWFAPGLSNIKTLSANGVGNVEPTFSDYFRLVLFSHLEAVYKNFTWVRVDGDEAGRGIVASLRSKFKDWDQGQFDCFDEPQFEHYYPDEFKNEIEEILGLPHGKHKQSRKNELRNQVDAWIREDEERGRKALENSARYVIDDLRRMESIIKNK